MPQLLLPPKAPPVPAPVIPAPPPMSFVPIGPPSIPALGQQYALPPSPFGVNEVAGGFVGGGITAAVFTGPQASVAVPVVGAFAAGFAIGTGVLYVKDKFFPAPLPPADPPVPLPPSSGKFSIKLRWFQFVALLATYTSPFSVTETPISVPPRLLLPPITRTIKPDPYGRTEDSNVRWGSRDYQDARGTTSGQPQNVDIVANDLNLPVVPAPSTPENNALNPAFEPSGFNAPAAPPKPAIPDTAPPPLYNPIPDGAPNIVPFKPSPSPTKPDPTPEPEIDPQPSPEQPPDEPQPAPPNPDPDPDPDPNPNPNPSPDPNPNPSPTPSPTPTPNPSPTPSPAPAPPPQENPPVAPNFPAPTPTQPPAPSAPDPEPTPPPIIFPIAPNFPDPQPTPAPAPTPQPQTPVDPLPGQPPAPAQPQQPSPTPKPPTQPSQPPAEPQPLNPETPVAPSPTPLPNPLNPFGLTIPDGTADPDGISEDPYEEGIFKDPDEYPGDGMGIGIPPGNVPTSPIPNFGVPPVPGAAPVTPPVPLTPAPVVSTPPQLGIPTTPTIPTVVPQIPPGAKPVFQPGTTPAPIVPVTPDAPLDPCKSSNIDPCTGQISDTLKTSAALTAANAAGIAALAAGLVPVPTPVKIFVKCENNAPVYGVQVVGIPANQVGYVPALFEKIANTEGKSCSESNAIATVPEWWQLRPEANRPQGILVFKEIRPDGTIGKDPYSITIPHCTLTAAPPTSPLVIYKKGSVQGILTLKDNSKLIVNCKDEEECERVIGVLSLVISSTQLDGSSTKIGDRKGLPFKDIEVKAQRLDFYPNGVKTMKPSYIKSFF